jgi:AcrR family transcriptional regulator
VTIETRGRTRLDPEARRAQLIELGLEMLSRQPREQVAIDRIAEAAGISRGLLFHYFPTKRAYHLAVVRAAADRMLAVTEPDADLPLIQRLRSGLEAYVDYVMQNEALYVSLVRGAAGGDDELQAVFDRTRARVAERVLDAIGLDENDPAVRVALRGWVGFVEEATLDWLRHHDLERDVLVDLHQQTLVSAIEAALRGDTASSLGG